MTYPDFKKKKLNEFEKEFIKPRAYLKAILNMQDKSGRSAEAVNKEDEKLKSFLTQTMDELLVEVEKKKKPLGMLFGAYLFVETDSDDTARQAQKWLETLDMRYRQAGEEAIQTDIEKLSSFKGE